MKRVYLKPKAWWGKLSVSHKLYGVVGVMALLIATELFTLLFAMRTLSAVRAFVGGEALWSKAQKGAVLELLSYAHTRNPHHWYAYKNHLRIPIGDHNARVEMAKPDMNLETVRQGFLEGQIHQQDIQPMIELMTRFHRIPYIMEAMEIWGEGDVLIFEMMEIAERMHKVIKNSPRDQSESEIQYLRSQIFAIDERLTGIEVQFSAKLGDASRWLEHILMVVLVIAVVTVESTGLLLTITFGRRLKSDLTELHTFATSVGDGDFSKTVPVRSKDELGQLAAALNKMAANLKESNSERNIADRANRVKSLFLANMSHEIRTPLNAILGFVDLLKDSSLGAAERRKYLDIIERTGNSLSTIINDILDISKVEAGKLEIVKVSCSLKQILRDLEALLSIRCEEKGINLTFLIEDLPDNIVTDPTRLKQILLNVIGNAIKFTSRGSVLARFEAKDSMLVCTVEDTGVGISKDSVQKLFQPFSQVDLSIRKRFGGTGLGLIVSKRLAHLLGGDVTLVESKLGSGSKFEVKVHLEIADTEPARTTRKELSPIEPLKGKKILIVEDSIDNQLLAEQYLVKAGAQVAMANHGVEAVDAALNDRYDLVLMDMQMPVMDGYSATASLRKKGCKTPIIALTAHAMREDLDRCLHVGCTAFLTKPYRRDNLVAIIAQYCEKAA